MPKTHIGTALWFTSFNSLLILFYWWVNWYTYTIGSQDFEIYVARWWCKFSFTDSSFIEWNYLSSIMPGSLVTMKSFMYILPSQMWFLWNMILLNCFLLKPTDELLLWLLLYTNTYTNIITMVTFIILIRLMLPKVSCNG